MEEFTESFANDIIQEYGRAHFDQFLDKLRNSAYMAERLENDIVAALTSGRPTFFAPLENISVAYH